MLIISVKHRIISNQTKHRTEQGQPASPVAATVLEVSPQSEGGSAVAAPTPVPAPALAPVFHAMSPCEGGQDVAPGLAMVNFIVNGKRKVDDIMTRVGHGSKRKGVRGILDRGSPLFYLDDPVISAVPDLETHWCTPVFVCIWELIDKYITAPPCPYCGGPNHVSIEYCTPFFSVHTVVPYSSIPEIG